MIWSNTNFQLDANLLLTSTRQGELWGAAFPAMAAAPVPVAALALAPSSQRQWGRWSWASELSLANIPAACHYAEICQVMLILFSGQMPLSCHTQHLGENFSLKASKSAVKNSIFKVPSIPPKYKCCKQSLRNKVRFWFFRSCSTSLVLSFLTHSFQSPVCICVCMFVYLLQHMQR